MFNTSVASHKHATENQTRSARFSNVFTNLLSNVNVQNQTMHATAVVVVFIWWYVIARQFADLIRVCSCICPGGECRSAPLVHDDRLLAEDKHKKERTLDVSPGPFCLRKFAGGVAKGRAEDEKGDDREDVVVNRLHIPNFCTILEEPFKRVLEYVGGEM